MLVADNKVGKDAWLKAFSRSYQTVKVYRKSYERFVEFMNETEKGEWDDNKLLEEREIDLKERNYAFEQKVVEFHRWLGRLPEKLSDSTKKTYIASICSFFAFHRMDLKFTRQQRNLVYKRIRPARRYYDFTLDDLKEMSKVASPKEKYVLLVGKSLGLRASDFIRLEQGTFEAHMKGEAPVSLGEIYTKKEGVKACPFLDEDAVEASKTWLQILESKGKRASEARVINITEQELTLILKRLAKRAKIETGNEIVRFHQLRVFLITRLSKVMETNRWKQVVGKEVPESSYVKSFNLREDYAKVMEYTTVREKVAQDEVIKLKEEVKVLKERENGAQTEVWELKNKFKMMEQEMETMRKAIAKLERRREKGLLEIYGGGEPPSTEVTELTEEIEVSEEKSGSQ